MGPDLIDPTPWAERLAAALPLAASGAEPEAIHQLRIACARLVVWRRLGHHRTLVDDLRWLRRTAGAVRDLDVLLAAGGSKATAQVRKQRPALLGNLRSATQTPRIAGLLAALGHAAPLPRAPAERLTARWQRRLLTHGQRLDWSAAPPASLHAFRRRLRRLRFALEWLDRESPVVKQLGDYLGDANDLALVVAWPLTARAAHHAEASLAKIRLLLAPAWQQVRAALEAPT